MVEESICYFSSQNSSSDSKLNHSFDIFTEEYLEREVTTKSIFFAEQEEEGHAFVNYPEGLFLCLPDSISPDEIFEPIVYIVIQKSAKELVIVIFYIIILYNKASWIQFPVNSNITTTGHTQQGQTNQCW